MSQPPKNPYQTPIKQAQPVRRHPHTEGDATGGVIPYKNPKALIAYYLGIASMLPPLFWLGIASVILGILGLKDRKKNPVIKGSAHAWIGIVLGTLSMLCWGSAVVLMIVGLVANA